MNKDKPAISERDKKLLMILCMLLAAFLCYYFVLNPALMKANELKQQYFAVKTEHQRIENLMQSLPELKRQEVEEKKLILEKYKQFFYEINEERILYKLNITMAEAGFPVESVSFTRPSAAEISVETAVYEPLVYPLHLNASKTNPSLVVPEGEAEEGANQQQNEEAFPADAAAFTDITIGFSASSYESIYRFLEKMEALDRTIIVKKIEIANSQQNSGIQGQIVLGVYSLSKPDEAQSTDLEFDQVLPKGKANPFL